MSAWAYGTGWHRLNCPLCWRWQDARPDDRPPTIDQAERMIEQAAKRARDLKTRADAWAKLDVKFL